MNLFEAWMLTFYDFFTSKTQSGRNITIQTVGPIVLFIFYFPN